VTDRVPARPVSAVDWPSSDGGGGRHDTTVRAPPCRLAAVAECGGAMR
jgi:hypothetical protein